MMMTRAEKMKRNQQDKMIEVAFRKVGVNRQFPIFNLTKLFDAGRAALESGADLEKAMAEAVEKLAVA